MGRGINRLTAKRVAATTRPGRYADGGGLYLVVTISGARQWSLIYSRGQRGAAKRTELGLGSAVEVPLAEARDIAAQMRLALRRGEDPRTVRRKRAQRTFGEAADAYIDAMAGSWRNPKHVAQWRMTLGDAYCRSLRPRPIADVDVADVLAVLQPIWQSVPETASRIRGRIEAVLDAAAALEQRPADNPARWRGKLAKLLPPRRRLSRGHHRAMDWQRLPEFLAEIRGRDAMSAVALEWTILTACRTGEVIAARRSEIQGDVWTIPATRMKAGAEHRVPLGPRCLEILALVGQIPSPWLFPAHVASEHLSNMAMLELVKPYLVTVHGFRSSFRDWAAEATSFPSEVAEMALAHTIRNKTEAAYRRGDLFAKRRQLMLAWERYCLGQAAIATVTRLSGTHAGRQK